MNPIKYVGGQFKNPRGLGGVLSTFIMNIMNQRQYKGVICALNLSDGDTVLDVGFGNGYVIQKLAKAVRCRFYGVDMSADMLGMANKRNEKFIDGGSMSLMTGDVARMSFGDCFFDKIYTVNTIYFWKNIDAGLSEIRRVLKNGGTFFNAVYTVKFLESFPFTKYEFAKYTLDDLKSAAAQNGFEIAQIITLKKDISYCFALRKKG
ncbi:methyltransferase [Clostridia bacterium]|nr:methyltransferase [Clostridia bacterium]GHU74762.1 methyltransferase [Clostridia bacterium]